MLLQRMDPAAGERPERVLVAAAPAARQGDLRLGDLAGPYLAGDILARYLRLRGAEVAFACAASDPAGLAAAEIEPDRVIGADGRIAGEAAGGQGLQTVAEEIFRRLHAGGKLAEKTGVALACAVCARPVDGPRVRGRCRRCGAHAADTLGLACAGCGWPTDGEVDDAVCTECGGRPVACAVRRLYLPLSRYAGALAEHYRKAGMGAPQRAFLEEATAAGLPDLPVTEVADRGIPVPVAGYDGQVLSRWLEGAARTLAAAGDAGRGRDRGWERFWKSGRAQVVDCFGSGDLFLQGLAVPALLLAFDPEIRPAAAFVSNEPCRGDLPLCDLLGEVPADLLRFHLAYARPESEPADFRRADLAATVERELVGGWQPWLAELGAKLAEERGGAIPATGDWTEDHRRFYARLQELVAEAAAGYEPRSFSPQQATRACCELVRAARRFGKAEAHWRRVAAPSEERRTGLALELLAAKALALMAAPVMPAFAARLWRELGFATPLGEARWEDRPSWLPGGQALQGLGGPYFASAGAPAAMAQAIA